MAPHAPVPPPLLLAAIAAAALPSLLAHIPKLDLIRELKRAGYSQSEMVRFASEVIDQVSQDFRASTPPDADDAS